MLILTAGGHGGILELGSPYHTITRSLSAARKAFGSLTLTLDPQGQHNITMPPKEQNGKPKSFQRTVEGAPSGWEGRHVP